MLERVPGKSWESKQAYRRICGCAVFAEYLAGWLACGDQRRRTGSSSALEALCDNALDKRLLYFK